jgi:flagellin-like hook-associated protein FlgL
MTPSALEKDIQDIQEKLARLSCEIEKFEAQSKTTISADHTMMLSQLRESVDAVHHTNHFLETGHSRVIKHIHMIPGAWVEDIPTEDAVKLHSEDIHAKFSSLRDTTKSALVRVEEIKEQCDDFDVSLDRITNEVKAVTTRAKSALGTAQSSLAAKETQLANTKKTLTEKQGQIQNMESQMKSKRDDRDIMRVVSVPRLVD